MSFSKTISIVAALASIFGAGAAGWKLAQEGNQQPKIYEERELNALVDLLVLRDSEKMIGFEGSSFSEGYCLKVNSISHYNDNTKTLWRLKLYNSNYSLYNINHSIIKEYYSTLNISHCDLSAAAFYPYPQSNMVNNQLINTVTKSYLYNMFYNLDKFHYGEYGTPTANMIRNAIRNHIIKYFQ